MKILTALTYYRPHYSGLTIYAERLARALADVGHKVTVLTSQYDGGLSADETRDGIRVVRLRVAARISKGVIMPAMLWHAWKHAAQADVLHLHLPQLDAAYLALIGKILRKPVVVTYHCDLRLPSGAVNWLANHVSHLANHITAAAADMIVTNTLDYAQNSPFLKNYMKKIKPVLPPAELSLITSGGIDAFRKRIDARPGEILIGMAARLATEKGVEYLAQSLPAVLQDYPQARVLFVGQYQDVFGEEEYARRLAPIIDSLGKHWMFLGNLLENEMAAFFQVCDVTVLPSLNSTESFGMVQVESMLAGTPVVASDLPGIRQPVLMTGMGKIIPAGDYRSLAHALLVILAQPDSYSSPPADLAEIFSPKTVAREYEDIFMKLKMHNLRQSGSSAEISALGEKDREQ